MKEWHNRFIQSLVPLFLLFQAQWFIVRAQDSALGDRGFLKDHERQMYQVILDSLAQKGSTPTKEQIETSFSHSLDDAGRAALSAKLYFEHGIIGALLSDDERRVLTFLFQHRRSLNSLGELADKIRSESSDSISTLRALNCLEFLYTAQYIDVRDGGEHVYLILPKGFSVLQSADHVHKEIRPIDPFERVKVNLSHATTPGKSAAPVTTEDKKHLPEEGTETKTRPTPSVEFSPLIPSSPEEAASSDEQLLPSPMAESLQQKQGEGVEDALDQHHPETVETPPLTSEPPRREPEPVATVVSQHPLGPPAPKPLNEEPESVTTVAGKDPHGLPTPTTLPQVPGEKSPGFSVEVMRQREKRFMPCAPDFWGWPYLYGQDNIHVLAFTADTGTEVRILVEGGTLISYEPRDVFVLNEGQHGDIRFFLSEEGLRSWLRTHPHVEGNVMTLPEALSWARRIIHPH